MVRYQNVAQRHEVSRCCWKDGTERPAPCGVVTDPSVCKTKNNKKKKLSVKCSKICLYFVLSPLNFES